MNKSKYIIFIFLLIFAVIYCFGSASAGSDKRSDEVISVLTRGADTSDNSRFNDKLPSLGKSVDPDKYILGPYDRLLIAITGTESRTFDLFVLPEGNIFLPGIGALRADGISLSEFRVNVLKRAMEHFHDIELNCYLLSPRVFKVFVSGEVNKPGMVEVSAVECVSEAIKKAGGITPKGSKRMVEVKRKGEVITLDLLKIITQGDLKENMFLSNGDAIHVPPARKHVNVNGCVKRPNKYEMMSGETINDIIHLAGGMTGEAVKDSVLLSRVVSGDTVTTFSVYSDGFDEKLMDLDVINILDRFNTSDRVFVFGAVEKTGRFYITEGEKLSNLLARMGSFNNDADLRAASMERRNKEHMRIDLTDYLSRGLGRDIRLKDGDKLYVPSVQAIVAVGGEVNLPGSFKYQGDLTVAHYVGLAGGPTEKGSLDRIVIYSTDGSARKATKDARPNRGDVIIVKKSGARLMAEFFNGVIRLGTVVISVIVLTR